MDLGRQLFGTLRVEVWSFNSGESQTLLEFSGEVQSLCHVLEGLLG